MEMSMTDAAALGCLPKTSSSSACVLEETKNMYHVEATGASVTADSSFDLLLRYYDRLPNDKHNEQKLKFEFSFPDASCTICTLFLPDSACIQKLVGPPSRDSELAKQNACLEACKKLHQLGALDDHLQPCVFYEEVSDKKKATVKSVSGAGSTKRKELHGTTLAHALSGTWGEMLDGVFFHAYNFDFSCNKVGEVYSGFVLLIDSKLDEDVGNVEIDLFLIGKIVKASVSYHGRAHLTAEEVKRARCFQEFLFNGLFGKLFVGSRSSEQKREFLLQTDTRPFWCSSYMYLLLPLGTSNPSDDESGKINWKWVDSCVSIAEFFKKNSQLNLLPETGNCCNGSAINEEEAGRNFEGKTFLHFSNGMFEVDNLQDMVVVSIHTGRIYSIVEADKDLTGWSPFEAHSDAPPSEYSSYTDYFQKKYGIVLMHPNQPLMRLKQSHNAHNVLVNFNDDGAGDKAVSGAGGVAKKTQFHVYIPPELLISVDMPRSVVRSLYLVPSMMHRLESLVMASQLRQEIDFRIDDSFRIPSSLVLEALTTLRCAEAFSMERLELLGDSVLKYTVSCHLFLKYLNKQEGQLTSQRSSYISNSNLHRLGTNRNIQGYIRDCAFDPRRWVAPGQRTLFPVPCKCGVNTREVPLDPKYFTEDLKIKLGKSCDMGHRWMVSKSISDCIEALIGAYYLSGGLAGALHMIKWIGVDVELDPKLMLDAISSASLRSYVPKDGELSELETKLGYEFSVKFLLKEAITHMSVHTDYCYERVEFLGDAVLDILITRHLFHTHTEIDPGELTDLRAACVNNESFAQVAVRKNLYKHLQCCSTSVESRIQKYLMSFSKSDDKTESTPSIHGPKELGDLVESIAGAMLIDTKLDLDQVWRIFKPLLSPLVTPEKLELPPFRELNELCASLGYFMREKCIIKGNSVHVELQLQLEDVLLSGHGSEQTRKLAKGKAASCLLKQLEKRNISRESKTRKRDGSKDDQISEKDSSESRCFKKLKTDGSSLPSDSSEVPRISSSETPVVGPISMNKGGPRQCLFEFCKKQLWPMPSFSTAEEKLRTPLKGGVGNGTGFISFISTITLRIPKGEALTCSGEDRPDKKSSFDSAALAMLHHLHQRGNLIILNPQEST